MYIITTKFTYVISGMGNRLEYLENGYPCLTEENISYVVDSFDIHEVSEVPSEVILGKYCYTEEQGFYLNPNWVDPDPTNTYGIPDETYHAIINDLTSEVASNGY